MAREGRLGAFLALRASSSSCLASAMRRASAIIQARRSVAGCHFSDEQVVFGCSVVTVVGGVVCVEVDIAMFER